MSGRLWLRAPIFKGQSMDIAENVDVPLIVGETYWVKCLYQYGPDAKKDWWPILSSHVGDISGTEHWHIDQRFLIDSQMELVEETALAKGIYACEKCDKDNLMWRVRKCQRDFEDLYPPEANRNWRILQVRLRHKKMENEICPHMRFNLNQVKPVTVKGKLCKVCPNHRITWSTEDGSLVRRKRA